MIRAIHADDEALSRDTLKKLLEMHCPEVELVAQCENAETARIQIETLKPQLVFLDIAMPGKNGFGLLRDLDEINFEVIFVTAHNEYTIQAIRYSAVDYLLKPIDDDELIQAVERVKKRLKENGSAQAVEAFLHNTQTARSQQEMQLCIPGIRGFQVIKISDIIYCEAENTYTAIYLRQNQKLLASRPLIDYELLLQDAFFIRIHKSYLINMQHLKEYLKGDGGSVIMSNGRELEVSRRKKEYFVAAMKQHFKY